MRPRSTEHASETHQLTPTLARGIGATGEALRHVAHHMTTLTFGLVFLMGDLEKRRMRDRAAVAERSRRGAVARSQPIVIEIV